MSTTARPGGVLALLLDREADARLHEALRRSPLASASPAALVTRVSRVAELRGALTGQPWALVVVEARDADRVPTTAVIREIADAQPNAVVVGYARKRDLSAEVLDLARAGVHELIMEGVDDQGIALGRALTKATARATADRLADAVAALVPSSFAPVLRYCMEQHAHVSSVADLARAFGVSRQALVERARRAALPSPRELVAWCRLLLAARLLAERWRSVDSVAYALHFPSGNGLRNALRRHAQLTVKDVRRDGVAPVLAAFREAVAAARVTEPAALA